MRRVKICGITNLKDALDAIDAGADALGFVFYPKSPRYITPKKAKEIVDKLPPFVERVGLFVNVTPQEINSIAKEARMSLVQIHFDVNEEFVNELNTPYLRVIRAKSKDDILRFQDSYRIVDAFVQSYGGEGKRVDTSWFEEIDCSKIILAGGLDSKNLKEVKRFNFYGFDVSSGVEAKKGKKDRDKMVEFVKEARI